jgi:predicted site-specific integrase-resolvase
MRIPAMNPLNPKWVAQRVAADQLGISERTLLRWRTAGFLKLGIHYRRKFPAPNSPLLYHLELCEQAMIQACARDARTLELVGA